MCLRFVYLFIVSALSWMRLARRQCGWKEAEILLLRHQLDVVLAENLIRPGERACGCCRGRRGGELGGVADQAA
jgi:hypothetical protein